MLSAETTIVLFLCDARTQLHKVFFAASSQKQNKSYVGGVVGSKMPGWANWPRGCGVGVFDIRNRM